MKTFIKRAIEITITLNEIEARYLRDLLQNDLSGSESVEDAQIRGTLFEALKAGLNGE